ncbi:MAG: glutamate-cysteine ligase family protein [Defluviitaleaceae bacterium]|nr:glutamate-cysteine ligase family protein [Defluviitaleaceae bacterium]MCL2239493.1 glutamate-cysteine ligase family protein [Defluviitaleaceae bacterium]
MDYRGYNLSAIADYFSAGCKSKKQLGLELEHFIVDRGTGLSLPYPNGVERVLLALQPAYGRGVFSGEHIIGIAREKAPITLEPAAQLEISIGPCCALHEIAEIYAHFRHALAPILDAMECDMVCAGYHPKSTIEALPMIPKERYDFMYKHFQSTGTHGKYMMKGTAATQVSIDFADEADFSRKFRVANVLGPLLALLCDNARVFEGEPYAGRMLRTHIWNNVDPSRSAIATGALEKDFGFRDYAAYVYDAPCVFAHGRPVSAVFAHRAMEPEEITQAVSMMFPDVCLKNHIEIRVADSMPIESAMGYLALIKGIFYDSKNFDTLHRETTHLRGTDVSHAKEALMEKGAQAWVYGKTGADWLDTLFAMAKRGLPGADLPFLLELEKNWRPSNEGVE